MMDDKSLWPDYTADIALAKNLAAHVNRLWSAERGVKALMLTYAEALGLKQYDVKAVLEYDASRIGLLRVGGDRKIVMIVWFNGRAQTSVNGTLTDTPMAALESPEALATWYTEAKAQADRVDSELQQKKADVMKAVREAFGQNAVSALEATVRQR